ncbi:MAG: hypothetical protein M3P41_08940 [Actinomycetota bacterium]|jgi:uncharacterized protein YxjI|nr:hypothetical protein [Actinomycetota bacterium]
MGPFDYDRYLVDQLVRPIVNLYRVTPLAAGETPAGGPIAFVRQKKMAIKENIKFFADDGETQELFHIQARTWLDTGGSKYDVVDAQEGTIGLLEHLFKQSLLRSTWRLSNAAGEEVAVARERSQVMAILRRAVDFVPDYGGLIPIPYNFDILAGEQAIGRMDRKFKLRDQYVLDLSGDHERKLDRRLAIALAIGLDTLQNR